jgi:hypothetical protein
MQQSQSQEQSQEPRQEMEPVQCGYCPKMVTQEQVDSGEVVVTKVDEDFGLVHRICYDRQVLRFRAATHAPDLLLQGASS